jgi:hypothetical protein
MKDETGRSFLFTLKNRSGLGPRKFRLKNGSEAIYRRGDHGVSFGYGHDICLLHESVPHYTNLGVSYENTTGLDGKTVFTGASNFQPQEVEVFEIKD